LSKSVNALTLVLCFFWCFGCAIQHILLLLQMIALAHMDVRMGRLQVMCPRWLLAEGDLVHNYLRFVR